MKRGSYLEKQSLVSLSPGEIDVSGPWLFWPRQPPDSLIQSIRDYGLLEPVLLERSQSGWSLISGLQRVRACYLAGLEVLGICCCCSELEKGMLYLNSNLYILQDPVKLIAPARFLEKRSNDWDWKEHLKTLAGGFLNRRDWQLLEKWLCLSPYWDQYLENGNISLETSPWISEFTESELSALEPFWQNMHWSRNNSLNLVKWVFEISKSKREPLEQVLEKSGVRCVLDENLSPRDAQKKILEKLHAARYPILDFLNRDFSRLRRRVLKNMHWDFWPEKDFETNRIYLQIQVENSEQVQNALRELQRLYQTGSFEEVWQWQENNLE